jgi:hypothetical protein
MTVPAFSSLPGADHTIYLDFDGHTIEGTNWNSYYNQTTLVAPEYNTDGVLGFSPTELAHIEEVWKRVSEDFRPFNVNVTTVDPGVEALSKTSSTDKQWGIRALITKETMVTDPAYRTGAGGIAYIGSFNYSNDTPALIFTSGPKNVSEAASHEVGHSLNLSHDGITNGATYYTGHGDGEVGWAPIMGVGYYKNVTQWDKGEYYNSNNGDTSANYGNGPDDLSIITTKNGFSYRADDHGNFVGDATPLNSSPTSLSSQGIIETTSDVDVFSFETGAGSVTINITPFTPGPNLDVRASIYTSAGVLVATSNDSTTLSAKFSLALDAGQYFVYVDGAGWGSPSTSPATGYSKYASLGQYFVTGTVVAAPVVPKVSIGDVTVTEGGDAVFPITLSQASDVETSVNWATSDGSDFIVSNGVAVFPAGVTTVYVTVPTIDDTEIEGTETFTVSLSSPNGLSLANGVGTGTITDNDIPALPTITVSDKTMLEGNTTKASGNSLTAYTMLFTVKLSQPSTQSVSFNYTTKDGTATTANRDYKAKSGTVTFSAGQTTQYIFVSVYGDNRAEADESFTLVLSNPVNATLSSSTAIGTILNDDTSAIKSRIPSPIVDPMSHFMPVKITRNSYRAHRRSVRHMRAMERRDKFFSEFSLHD